MIAQANAAGLAQGTEDYRAGKAYYRPELDALRFFAFLCVFWFHRMAYVATDPTKDYWMFRIGTIGSFGVPVFFLLSAFLITELLTRERERTGRVHIRAFYMRRILRIWPLYFVGFFGLALMNRMIPGVGADHWHAWLAFTFFLGNVYVGHHGWLADAVDPLWSISVEEQFYLVVPLLAAFGGRRSLLYASYVVFAIAYVRILLYGLHPTLDGNAEWTSSLVHFQFFCAGTLISLYLRGRLAALSMPQRHVGFATAIACWLIATMGFHVQSLTARPTAFGTVAGSLFILLGTVILFVCTLGIASHLVPAWLSYCGRISYGLYIVHSLFIFLIFGKAWPYLGRHYSRMHLPKLVLDDVGTILVLGFSLVAAHFSYTYLERPFLLIKERFTFVPLREEATLGQTPEVM